MGLFIQRKTDAEIRAEKQKNINAIRRGGFRKMAAREQAKLDRANAKSEMVGGRGKPNGRFW